jgi:hypothetical protein
MKRYLMFTARERAGSMDGLNLFFGALLGANLGTLSSIDLLDYAQFIIILAGTVMALRFVSTSERRIYAFATLAAYALFLLAMWNVPAMQPGELPERDFQRTLVTLAIWVGAVLLLELTPTLDAAEEVATPFPAETEPETG